MKMDSGARRTSLNLYKNGMLIGKGILPKHSNPREAIEKFIESISNVYIWFPNKCLFWIDGDRYTYETREQIVWQPYWWTNNNLIGTPLKFPEHLCSEVFSVSTFRENTITHACVGCNAIGTTIKYPVPIELLTETTQLGIEYMLGKTFIIENVYSIVRIPFYKGPSLFGIPSEIKTNATIIIL